MKRPIEFEVMQIKYPPGM